MRDKILSTLLLVLFIVAALTGRAAAEAGAPAAPEPATGAAAGSAPSIVFDELEHDFGILKQQQSVKYIFKFRNEGGELLVIENVKASCGCTGTLLSSKEIQPGEEGEIEVTFKSAMSSGKKKKSITITSNDPAQPVKLYIMANIVVPLEIKPKQIYWVADKGEPSRRMVELAHQPDLDINIVDLKLTSDAFTASATPKAGGENPGYDIEIRFDGSLPVGRFTEKLTIVTDNKDYPTFAVAIRGNVAGLVRVVPNAIALGVVKDDALPSRTIRVYTKGNRDFEITSIKPTSPLITAEIVKDVEANGYNIKVSLNSMPPKGAFSEKIRIETSLDPATTIDVAVYAYVQ
jgi:hypothetical protein